MGVTEIPSLAEGLDLAMQIGQVAAVIVAIAAPVLVWRLQRVFPTRVELGALDDRVLEVERGLSTKADKAVVNEYRDAHLKLHEALTRQLGEIEDDVLQLKVRVDALPTKDDIGGLRTMLAEVQSDIRNQATSLAWLKEGLDVLVKHEIGGGSANG